MTAGAAEERVRGMVDEMTDRLDRHLRPPLTWLQASMTAISYNDDQVRAIYPQSEDK